MLLRKPLEAFINLPLRAKFILSFLIVIILGGILTLFIGTRIEHQTIFSLAQAKVRHDLASAWMVYHEKLNDIRDIVLVNSTRESILNAIINEERGLLFKYLDRVRREFSLDILTLTDFRGHVLLRTRHPESSGDDQSEDPLIRKALRGETVKAAMIVPRSELLKEGKDLSDRAYVRIVPTPKAEPREEEYEENGIMLKAAVPIIDDQGAVRGVLYGGILLNRNYDIVDRVKEIVYKGEKYKGREIGTATIFQYDLRISTNVQNAQGGRAIGTRVSKEVNRAVLVEGRSWIDRAFVVNDWYIAAYEPINNIHGEIIGILYVGMLEKPYIDLRNRVMLTFTGMAAVLVVILLVILFFITSSIIHPLQGMVLATKKIAQGNLSHKVEMNVKDEIGQLAESFNQMTANLKEANEKLLNWGKTLEKRVAERTQELKETQDFLVQSEKLASLGKMAAGIAHEVNNPLTSILLNTHLMLEKLKEHDAFFESLSMIADETSRCTNIVKGLLEFSRQEPPQKSFASVNDVITRTVNLLANQASYQNIEIIKHLDPNLPLIEFDTNKIKQVFWNFMLNASEAMPQGGTLTITSRFSRQKKYIEILFQDTGIGIPKQDIGKLFDPFFTTKESGTGLGLAVTYGIIKQHNGHIEVDSEPEKGSTFKISLPIEQSADITSERKK